MKENMFSDQKLIFYSGKMMVSKKKFKQNYLKLTYQKQLISDLEYKHKMWSKELSR